MNLILDNTTRLSLDAEGWALLAPFGEHRKTRRVRVDGVSRDEHFIQVLDNAAAAELVKSEGSLFGRLRRAFVGVPVFKRHPDLVDHSPDVIGAREQGAKIPIGTIARIRLGARGIEGQFSLTPEGAAAVENEGLEYPSPLWEVAAIGQRDGATVVRPTRLLSVGMTDHPNISGVDSLANANANTPAGTTQTPGNYESRITNSEQTTDPMKHLLIGWLAAQGVVLANDASDQTVLDAVQKINLDRSTNVTALGNEKTTLGSRVTTLENEIAAGKSALQTEQEAHGATKTTLANAQESLKTERKARIELLLDKAVQEGRITAAERPQWAGSLANEAEFAAKFDELAKKTVTVKTTTTIGNQGDRRTTGDTALANCADFAGAVADVVAAGKTKSAAVDEVIRLRPDLYTEYRNTGGKI
jgi:hypothetical protein